MSKSLDVAQELVNRIRPILAGQSPEAIGAALGELCATFIASHAPPLRAEQRQNLFGLIDDLTPVIVEELIGNGRASKDWRA